ncbi:MULTISPECIES: HipA N-terminal domain-containing protein [Bacteroidales]|uniref:HipA N-terminal domain-containing protein n=1 Tax=Bacteroidales TaxID=171549 RepID=UPI0026707282|nr:MULTISPECIES: HipA N-terminal domain-containing protein [Bacteroidales]
MKQAAIYLYDRKAGLLTEDETGYTFRYDADYLRLPDAEAVSLTLPLTEQVYRDKVLFPFFDGLIPEGWLLDIAEKSWKIDNRDRMSLLLACCKDCIGAVGVVPIESKEE